MGSTFDGVALFDSGPHRFAPGPAGRHLLGPDRGANIDPYTVDRARLEFSMSQRGRLVSAGEAGLWAQAEAIRALAEEPRTGTLVDHSGRSWPGLTLVRFEAADRVDRGRVVSLGYAALYLRFAPL